MPSPIFAFDFDGVIADSLSVALDEYRAIIGAEFPEVPIPSGPDDLAFLFPGPLRSSLRRFGVSDDRSKRFFDLHSAAMRRRCEEVQLFAGVSQILDSLDIKSFGIITSAYSDAVRNILSRGGHGRVANQAFILGRELSIRKSEKFRILADRTSCDLKCIVKICDMVSDIIYAREVGVSVWAVGWGYHPLRYLHAFEPDRIVRDHRDLRNSIYGYEDDER